MNTNKKQDLHRYLEKTILDRIANAQKALDDIIYSRDNESKSTAGDKYETGRAMMQIAQQQQEVQLSSLTNLLQQLKNLNTEKVRSNIDLGSLVETNQGNFYISTAIGEVNFEDHVYQVISPASPIAQILLGKKNGNQFTFRTRNYEILKIS